MVHACGKPNHHPCVAVADCSGFVLAQAQDLGCVIRENLPQQIWVYLHRALHVLLHFKANEYTHVLTLHLLLLNYWRSVNHPAWKAFQHDPRMFSEEKCEANLSTVAKHSLSDPMRFDLQHVQKTLLLLTHSRGNLGETTRDVHGQKIDPLGPEVQVARNFLRELVASIKLGTARMYPVGAAEDWESKEDMKNRLVPFEIKMQVQHDVLPQFDRNVQRCKRLSVLNWLVTVRAAVEDGVVDDPLQDSQEAESQGSGDRKRAQGGRDLPQVNLARRDSVMSAADAGAEDDSKAESQAPRMLPRPRRRRRVEAELGAAEDGDETEGMANSDSQCTSDSEDDDKSDDWDGSVADTESEAVASQQSPRPPVRSSARAARGKTWMARFAGDFDTDSTPSTARR